METTAAQAAGVALRSLTTPPEPQAVNIEALNWDFMWIDTGSETPVEKAIAEKMASEAQNFLSGIIAGDSARWLAYLGAPGSGKTHLADRIRWFLTKHGRVIYDRNTRPAVDSDSSNYLSSYPYAQEGAVMAKWGVIIEKMRKGDYGLFEKACRDHFKVIDDLGVDSFDAEGKPTAFAVQKMAELLERRRDKWTVITSNFSRASLGEKFDPRIASRLMRNGSVIVDCFGLDDFNLRREAGRKAA